MTAAPALPATTLAFNCYGHMLKNCTSLTKAPALPATTLADYCYAGMFEGDISLTDAPKLPAQQLISYCYHYMFNGCSSLSCVVTDLTAWTIYCTAGWLQNVAQDGVFMCPAELPDTRGASNIPTNWTKLAPPLCFTLEDTDSPTDIYIRKDGSPTVVSLEFSDNGIDWYDYDMTGSRGMSIPLDD